MCPAVARQVNVSAELDIAGQVSHQRRTSSNKSDPGCCCTVPYSKDTVEIVFWRVPTLNGTMLLLAAGQRAAYWQTDCRLTRATVFYCWRQASPMRILPVASRRPLAMRSVARSRTGITSHCRTYRATDDPKCGQLARCLAVVVR